MSLPITPDHLRREIDDARETLKKRRIRVREIIDGMSQGLMIRRDGTAQRLIENHYHEYTGLVLPRIVSGDPRVRVSTPRSGMARIAAAAGEAAVNQWIVDSRHRVLAQKLCMDFLLGWGVACLKLDETPEHDDVFAIPSAHRLDTGDAWWDLRASDWESRRFAGYSYLRDRDSLLELAKRDDTWNRAAIMALPLDADLDDVDSRDNDHANDIKRGEVALRLVWVPDYDLPNAPKWANGTLFTLAVRPKNDSTPSSTHRQSEAFYPRKPIPYHGPPWGPLYLYDAYYLPGQGLGMSPCEAVFAQVEEVNLHANQLSIATARRKRIGIGNAQYTAEVEEIRKASDGAVVVIDGFDKQNYVETTLGGADAEQRQALLELRDRLDRASGMSDAMRGNVAGIGTATEVVTASEAATARVGGLAQRFGDCDEMLLKGVLWHVVHTRALRIKVDPEKVGVDPELRDQIEIEIEGGPSEGMEWADYQLQLDRQAMARTSEAVQQARMAQLFALSLPIIEAAPRIASYTDIRMLLNRLGDAFNIEDYGDVVDPDGAVKLLNAQMEAMESTEPPKGSYAPAKPAKVAEQPGRAAGRKAVGMAKAGAY